MDIEKLVEEDRFNQELQGGFIGRITLIPEKKPLIGKVFLAKVFWFVLGLALGVLFCGKGEALAFDGCGAYMRSFAYHQAFHQAAHYRATKIYYCKKCCKRERRKYVRSTRSVYYQKPYRTSRSRRAYVYSCKPVRCFSYRNRVHAYPLLHQKFRGWRASYPRTVGHSWRSRR